ncbi:MAG: tripartite tricarboxylate transporter substrate binding protein [Pseudomonadota bacterium]
MPRSIQLSRRAAMAAAMLLAARPGLAAWTPSQPIRIFNGYPPGGSVDIVFRILADGVLRLSGKTIVQEVRSGAYGFIAAQAASRAAPDGYTLASAIMGMMCVAPVVPGGIIPIDVDRDLTPVSALAGTPMALIARADAPFSNLEELAAYARSRNGAGTFASSGNGSINQLAAEHLLHELGVRMTHVAYRGGAPATLDVAARRIDIFMANIAEVAQLIRAGEVKALGITAATPVALLPELLPLAARYPSLEINNWFGVAGPANLPEDIRAGLAELFAQALADPQTTRTLRERGLEPMGESGAPFLARIRRDRERWRAVAIAGNIRSD